MSCNDVIVQALKGLQPYTIEDHITAVKKGQVDLKERKGLIFYDSFNDIIGTFGLQQQRVIKRAKSEKLSSWLSVLPIKKHNFNLSPVKFRHGIAIKCKKHLLCVPDMCDGCGSIFDLSYALSFKEGGLSQDIITKLEVILLMRFVSLEPN